MPPTELGMELRMYVFSACMHARNVCIYVMGIRSLYGLLLFLRPRQFTLRHLRSKHVVDILGSRGTKLKAHTYTLLA